ncbi:MAG: xanthine dehydrogenase family protein molybdopterin-binding subunit [Acidobacteriota bacterium]
MSSIDPQAARPLLESDRRQFLRGGMTLGAGLVVGFHWSRGRAAAATTDAAFAPNAFVRIGTDDTVTVMAKHLEMGQGAYTGLATILAEELDADWSTVRVEAAPSDVQRYANLFFGAQGTGGSTAMANSWAQLRTAGATARAMLVAAAAKEWSVDASEVTVKDGVVHHTASNRSTRFGALAEAAAGMTPPNDVSLKKPSEFTLIGRRDLPRVDVPEKTNGTATFTIDVRKDGMLTALIERPTRFGGKVASFDATAAKTVKGVVDVVEVPRGVAVVADSYWAAKKGRDALEVTWDDSEAEFRGSEELFTEYSRLARNRGSMVEISGNAQAGLERASQVLEAEFAYPFLAHAPMEPLDAVAHLQNGKLDIWAGSQLQTVDQNLAAMAIGLAPENVAVHTLLAGGSFGRRATPDGDVAVEAATVAKAMDDGRPVRVVWTREDDLRGGRYRPLTVHRIRAGLDDAGGISGWHHTVVTQPIVAGTIFASALMKNGIDNTAIEGARDLPYALPNFTLDLHQTTLPVPPLWWRSVGHTHTAYTIETFLDELAAAAGQDPLEFRLGLIDPQTHPRDLAVLELVADKAGWGGHVPEGRARGVALHKSFNSYVAQIAEVSIGADGLPKVEKVWCAVDCGIPINPTVIETQMQSGIGYGLGAALYDEIVLENGRVVNTNFNTYRSIRMHEMPDMEVHVVASGEAPTGVGEPGLPPIAPAVANAFAVLTGTRVRRLPFTRAIATS